MAELMLEKFKKYWKDIYVLMGVALILDPRCKTHILEYGSNGVYGEKSSEHVQKVKDAIYAMYDEYKYRSICLEESDTDNVSCSPVVPSQEIDKNLVGFDAFMTKKKKTEFNFSKTDLDKYLEVELFPPKPDFDILAWWKQNGEQYPILQLIAKDILAIPISTAASESAFSTSGRVIEPQRSRLHPKPIEALMCTQSWLKVCEIQDGDTSRETAADTVRSDDESENEAEVE